MPFLQVIFFAVLSQAQLTQNLQEEARQIMRTRLCGVCHIPPGNEKALKVFNLDKENWLSTMTDDQVAQIKWRIQVKGDEIKEQRGDPKKHTFTQTEVDLLHLYVERELKKRRKIR